VWLWHAMDPRVNLIYSFRSSCPDEIIIYRPIIMHISYTYGHIPYEGILALVLALSTWLFLKVANVWYFILSRKLDFIIASMYLFFTGISVIFSQIFTILLVFHVVVFNFTQVVSFVYSLYSSTYISFLVCFIFCISTVLGTKPKWIWCIVKQQTNFSSLCLVSMFLGRFVFWKKNWNHTLCFRNV